MKLLETLSEHYVIAHFLKHEIHSERFGGPVREWLQQKGQARELIERPDLVSEQENRLRRECLRELRGYSQKDGLFDCVPENVCWGRFALSRTELEQAKYVDYSYWNELSGGSRSPLDAAKRIREGVTVFGTESFLKIAQALEQGQKFPELIFVQSGSQHELIVLEGHVRLTVYFLMPEYIPKDLTAIVGSRQNVEAKQEHLQM